MGFQTRENLFTRYERNVDAINFLRSLPSKWVFMLAGIHLLGMGAIAGAGIFRRASNCAKIDLIL